MAKEVFFTGTKTGSSNTKKLEVMAVLGNEIFINIEVNQHNNFIYLDRSTAIKLHRELKKQISFIETEGGQNG
jgi:hypothetical protein